MREQSYPADEETTIKHQVPSPPSVRKSKRKMDRSRMGGRGLFKNPPQPHMCIRDALVGSKEPCFINVLSWDKISTPAYPEDTIPLYGGIQIFCNSMNSLVCTEFLKGFEPGKQPAIFAVLVNPQILKMSGKNADVTSRDSFVDLIEDFVENMNENVKFQHQFTVLVDRDVVGELKDIWFIIQSKREQERAETATHGDGDRNLTVRHNSVSKGQKQHSRSQENTDDSSLQQLWSSLDLQEKHKAPAPHFHPHANGSGKDAGWLYSQRDKTKIKEGYHQDRKITDFMPAYRKDQDELVWTSQLQYPPKHSVAGFNYIASSGKHSENFWTVGNASKEAPPSFQESIENKVRGFAQIRNSEKHNHKHVSPKRDKPLLHSDKNCRSDQSRHAMISNLQAQCDSFETEIEEDNMFDRVRLVVATEILPSLDGLADEYGEISSPYFALENVAVKSRKGDATFENGNISSPYFALKDGAVKSHTEDATFADGKISSPYYALKDGGIKSCKGGATFEDRNICSPPTVFLSNETEALEDCVKNVNDLQLSDLTDALLSLNHWPEDTSSSATDIAPLSPAEMEELIQENVTHSCLKDGSNFPTEMVANNCKLILKSDGLDSIGYFNKISKQNSTREEDSTGQINVTYKEANQTYQISAENLPSADFLENNVQGVLNEVNKNVLEVPVVAKLDSFCADCCSEIGNKDTNINLETEDNLEALAAIFLFSHSKAKASRSSSSMELALLDKSFSEDRVGKNDGPGNGIVRRSKSFTDLNFSIHGVNDRRSAHLRDN